MLPRRSILGLALLLASAFGFAQEGFGPFTTDFPPEEFAARRAKVYDAIGDKAFAVIQGAPSPTGYTRFRQSNDFYYLCGIEVPRAYLLLDGQARKATLFLPHRDEGREKGEGRMLSAEDGDEVKKLSGVDAVYGTDLLAEQMVNKYHRRGLRILFTTMAPAEGASMSRDLALRSVAEVGSDPFDGMPSREGRFVELVHERFPVFEIRDLSPTLDDLRLIKSPRELALIRNATKLAGLAILEGMRSTRPGQYEHELDAVGKFVFWRNGAQGDAYFSLIASAHNAWWPHYNAGKRKMEDGDFLLMDYAPDWGYYEADVTRMFPVNGKFSQEQRELYGFYLACYRAILKAIAPGKTGADCIREAGDAMDPILAVGEVLQAHPPQGGRGLRREVQEERRERVPVPRPLGRHGDARRRPARRAAQSRHGLHDRARSDGSGGEDLRPARGHDLHHGQGRRGRVERRAVGHRRDREGDEGRRECWSGTRG